MHDKLRIIIVIILLLVKVHLLDSSLTRCVETGVSLLVCKISHRLCSLLYNLHI